MRAIGKPSDPGWSLLLAALVLVLSLGSVWAEVATVTLKSGEQLQGLITAEDAQQITIDAWANKSGTIIHTRTILKADIQTISRETAEETEQREWARDYASTQQYELAGTNYTWSYYNQIIDGVFRPFLKKHPGSPKTDEVAQKAAAWISERDKVATGAKKRDGQWLDLEASPSLPPGSNAVGVAAVQPASPPPAALASESNHIAEAAAVPQAEQPPPPQTAWFKTHWMFLAVGAIVIVYIVCRRLE